MLGIGQPSDMFSSSAHQYVNRVPTRSQLQDLLLVPESQSSRVLARPNLVSSLTPRSDPFANTGSIRGSFAPIGQTAVHPYALMSAEETLTSTVETQNQRPHSILSVQQPSFTQNQQISQESYREKKEKNLISSSFSKNTMAQQRPVLELIDEPFVQAPLQHADFSRLGELDQQAERAVEKKSLSERPDLSFFDPKQLLPKSDIRSSFKDPQDPSNYMYDRTLFAPLKRRSKADVDFVRGDLHIAPHRFGWFDTPANPGTDLNAGFFNLNYPSIEQNVSLQDTQVQRQFPSLQAAQVEQIQFSNPYAGQSFRRGP